MPIPAVPSATAALPICCTGAPIGPRPSAAHLAVPTQRSRHARGTRVRLQRPEDVPRAPVIIVDCDDVVQALCRPTARFSWGSALLGAAAGALAWGLGTWPAYRELRASLASAAAARDDAEQCAQRGLQPWRACAAHDARGARLNAVAVGGALVGSFGMGLASFLAPGCLGALSATCAAAMAPLMAASNPFIVAYALLTVVAAARDFCAVPTRRAEARLPEAVRPLLARRRRSVRRLAVVRAVAAVALGIGAPLTLWGAPPWGLVLLVLGATGMLVVSALRNAHVECGDTVPRHTLAPLAAPALLASEVAFTEAHAELLAGLRTAARGDAPWWRRLGRRLPAWLWPRPYAPAASTARLHAYFRAYRARRLATLTAQARDAHALAAAAPAADCAAAAEREMARLREVEVTAAAPVTAVAVLDLALACVAANGLEQLFVAHLIEQPVYAAAHPEDTCSAASLRAAVRYRPLDDALAGAAAVAAERALLELAELQICQRRRELVDALAALADA